MVACRTLLFLATTFLHIGSNVAMRCIRVQLSKIDRNATAGRLTIVNISIINPSDSRMIVAMVTQSFLVRSEKKRFFDQSGRPAQRIIPVPRVQRTHFGELFKL